MELEITKDILLGAQLVVGLDEKIIWFFILMEFLFQEEVFQQMLGQTKDSLETQ